MTELNEFDLIRNSMGKFLDVVTENLKCVEISDYKYVSKEDILKLLEEPPKHPFPSNDYFYATVDLSPSMRTTVDKYICEGRETSHHLKQAVEYVCSLTQNRLKKGTTSKFKPLIDNIIDGFELEKRIVIRSRSNLFGGEFFCTLANVTVIFGEESYEEGDLLSCENQLRLNVGLLMLEQFYGHLPFVICYAAAREQIKFYAFIRRIRYEDKSTEILKTPKFIELKSFDFGNLKSRLESLTIVLNALRFFYSCKQECIIFPRTIPWVSPIETGLPNDRNMTIRIQSDYRTGGVSFVKRIKDWENLKSADSQNVERIYDSIKNGLIRHSYKDLHFYLPNEDDSSFEVESKFCRSSCLEYIRNSRDIKKLLIHIGEALSDMHKNGFVHRDLRLANIIYDDTVEVDSENEKGEFLLIDFEHSGIVNEQLKVSHSCNPKFVKGYSYQFDDDISLYLELITEIHRELNVSINSRSFTSLINQLTNRQITLNDFISQLKEIKVQ